MTLHTQEYERQRDQNHMTTTLLARLSGWMVPALIGAMLTLMFNISGDRANAAQTQIRVDKLEVQVIDIQKNLAAGGPPALARRVDDLQAQTQEQYKEVSKKLDAIEQLLLKGR